MDTISHWLWISLSRKSTAGASVRHGNLLYTTFGVSPPQIPVPMCKFPCPDVIVPLSSMNQIHFDDLKYGIRKNWNQLWPSLLAVSTSAGWCCIEHSSLFIRRGWWRMDSKSSNSNWDKVSCRKHNRCPEACQTVKGHNSRWSQVPSDQALQRIAWQMTNTD